MSCVGGNVVTALVIWERSSARSLPLMVLASLVAEVSSGWLNWSWPGDFGDERRFGGEGVGGLES